MLAKLLATTARSAETPTIPCKQGILSHRTLDRLRPHGPRGEEAYCEVELTGSNTSTHNLLIQQLGCRQQGLSHREKDEAEHDCVKKPVHDTCRTCVLGDEVRHVAACQSVTQM